MFTEAMQPEIAKSNECVTAWILLLREEQKKKGTESQDNVSQWEVVSMWSFLWCIETHLLNYY